MKIFIYVILTIPILFSCKPEPDSNLTEVTRQYSRDPICGVELYKVRESRQCGEIYRKMRARECGVERYNKRKSKACPGYLPPHSYTAKASSQPSCPKGYHASRRWTTKRTVGSRNVDREVTDHYVTCKREEVIASCRRKEFGAELFKSCRHRVNGIEKYKSCRHLSHGVEQYQQCEFYKNPDQALAYAELIESDLPMMRDHLLIHKGNIFALQNSELALACHIKDYEASILARESIESLKIKFTAVFGKHFNSANYDCSAQVESIDEGDCQGSDESPLCRSLLGYRSARKWFEETDRDLSLIIDELRNFGQQKVSEALETVAKYLKNPYNLDHLNSDAERD